MTLQCSLEGTCLRCAVELVNRGETPLLLGDVNILYFDRAAGSVTHLLADPVQVFSLGAATGDSELTMSPDEQNKTVFALTLSREEPRYASDNIFCAMPCDADELTPAVTYSFDRIGDVASGVVVNLEQGISRVRAAFRGASLPAGATRTLPTLFVDGLSPVHASITSAADRVTAVYSPKLRAQIPTGWCSWYYYYTKVTEEDILENLRFAAEHRERLPLEYVQIDDGYQRHWGDWLLPSGKFPHDMAWLAREIKGLGFKPGIWVAPLIMTVQSDLYNAHPEWALRRFESGEPYAMEGWSPKDENPWVILDGTHPEVLQYIKQLFTVMAHEWGYDYFKLDAMAFGGFSGIRHRPEMTGEQALRLVLETVREAIGPDKYILGCGVPFGAAVGIVDGERVSLDVSTSFWPDKFPLAMEGALPQSIHRSFIHGKWWHNDPDCVLVRRDGTPHEPRLSERGLSTEEARLFVTVVGLTQGIMMIGENLSQLDEERFRLLDMIQPPLTSTAHPLDLFNSRPERLVLRTPYGMLLGLLNWTPEAKGHTISMAELGLNPMQSHEVYELWTQQHLSPKTGDPLEMAVPAQGGRLLLIRATLNHPMILGFDGHVSCGASLIESERWDDVTGTLHVSIRANRPGLLQITAPEGWTLEDSTLCALGRSTWAVQLGKGDHQLSYRFRSAAL